MANISSPCVAARASQGTSCYQSIRNRLKPPHVVVVMVGVRLGVRVCIILVVRCLFWPLHSRNLLCRIHHMVVLLVFVSMPPKHASVTPVRSYYRTVLPCIYHEFCGGVYFRLCRVCKQTLCLHCHRGRRLAGANGSCGHKCRIAIVRPRRSAPTEWGAAAIPPPS